MARGQGLGLLCGKSPHDLLTRQDEECGRETGGRGDSRCLWPQRLEGDAVRNGEDCVRRFVEGAGRSAPGLGGVARFTRSPRDLEVGPSIEYTCQGLVRKTRTILDNFY